MPVLPRKCALGASRRKDMVMLHDTDTDTKASTTARVWFVSVVLIDVLRISPGRGRKGAPEQRTAPRACPRSPAPPGVPARALRSGLVLAVGTITPRSGDTSLDCAASAAGHTQTQHVTLPPGTYPQKEQVHGALR